MAGPDKYKLRKSINDHFVYEIDELYWCKKLWTMPVVLGFEERFINMNIEHTLLHARALYEFYYNLVEPPNVYNETAKPRANMFVPSFKKPPFTREITKKFEEKVNDQIAHYGINRTSVVKNKFKVDQTVAIATRLLKITKDFLNRLETEPGGFFFQAELKSLKSRMDSYIQFDPFKQPSGQVAIFPPITFPISTSVVAGSTSSLTSGNVFPMNSP